MTGQTKDQQLVLTVSQAAKLLQLSENTVYSLIEQKAIPHTRFGRLIRIPRWALLQFIADQSGSPLPANFEVAFDADQSVHGLQPDGEED